jgi:hypothetical protein
VGRLRERIGGRARAASFGALGLVGLSLLPLRLEVAGALALTHLGEGISLRAERVTAGWRPWDEVHLQDVTIDVPSALGAPIRIEGSRLRVLQGVSPLVGSVLSGLPERIELRDVKVGLGPVRIVDGLLEIERNGGLLRIRGWGSDASGGMVDVEGEVSPQPPHLGRIELYLAGLSLPLAPEFPALTLTGTFAVDRLGQESDRARAALQLLAREGPEASPVLTASVEGTIERHAGRFIPSRSMRIRGELRHLRSDPEVWGLHGPFRGAVGVSGSWDALETRIVLDLTRARIRGGRWMENPEGLPTEVRLRVSAEDGRPLGVRGELRLGRAHASAVARHDGAWSWEARTGWCLLADILPRVTALAEQELVDGGRVRAAFERETTGRLTGRLELADVGLLGGAGRLPRATLQFEDGVARLAPAAIELAGQPIEIDAELRRQPTSPAWAVGLRARSPRIRLDPLAELLPQELLPGESAPSDLEGTVRAAANWLHTRVFHLRELQIRPLEIAVERLSAAGIPPGPVRVEAALEDRMIRVRLKQGVDGGGPRHFCLDLKRWRPRLASVSDSESCLLSRGVASSGR